MKQKQGFVQVNFRVTPDEYERLYNHAAAQGRTVSDVIREFIRSLPEAERIRRKSAQTEMHAAF